MSPEQAQIKELQQQVKLLTDFMFSFNSAAQMSPQVQDTIQRVANNISLASLSDVSISAPSNGQVLKYNGTVWVNGTDNT